MTRPRVGMLAAAIVGTTAALTVAFPSVTPAEPVTLSPLSALVEASAQRLLIADDVAAAKWDTDLPINDPPRERQVLDAVTAMAAEQNLDTGFVYRVFRDQIDATEAVEYTRFAQWKFDPAIAPTTRPDLSAARVTIDRLNRVMVTEIAEQWDTLHTPGCRARLAAAQAAATAELGLDPLYITALTRATGSYCTTL
ncbi:chorismate mutase [Rhodococcus erythropolis]|uniref:chorismate mutase n=1 Tax=Rhodococcus erythropolis TaxID=1833 RepID=UPI00294A61FE|nr:chorismate mutase [Rhodococcus erythropolis]MDV6278065.1 chorismate mutase [Rhodococcus erythropolis]